MWPRSSPCTCRYGRDHDGSEFGPCEYCERVNDGHDDETVEAMINDFDPMEAMT